MINQRRMLTEFNSQFPHNRERRESFKRLLNNLDNLNLQIWR